MVNTDLRAFGTLTDRQRQVLDLLIEYKTSKEIGIIIGISHNTVDQHLDVCRNKFGAANRKDLARIYKNLRLTCQQTTYGQIRIENPFILSDSNQQSQSEYLLAPKRSVSDHQGALDDFDVRTSAGANLSSGNLESIAALGAILIFVIIIIVSVQ